MEEAQLIEAEAESAVAAPPEALPVLNPKQAKALRWLELALVLSVAFAEPLFYALYIWLTGAKAPRMQNASVGAALATVRDAAAIALLVYVLFRQGRGLRQLGFKWQWRDVPTAFVLSVVVLFASGLARLLIEQCYVAATGHAPQFAPRNIPDFNLTVAPILMMIVNPFYEELLLRAYTLSEVEDLTGKASAAFLFSVGLQTACHFYQGFAIALTYLPIFALFSLFYLKTRRITPIILSHMSFDLMALFALSNHSSHSSHIARTFFP